MGRRRKSIGVWVMLSSGTPWLYDKHASLDEAMRTARTLLWAAPGFPRYRVWIASAGAPSPRVRTSRQA